MKIELNFDTICRTCMTKTTDLCSIYENELQDKLRACCDLQVWENDGLPNNICSHCVDKVELAFSFRDGSKKSDASLRQMLRLKTEDSINEPVIKIETDYQEIEFVEDFPEPDNVEFDSEPEEEYKPNEPEMDKRKRKWKCDECQKYFYDGKTLRRHQLIHLGVKFECDLCKKTYSRPDRLREHMKIHMMRNHPDDPDPLFECDKCKGHFNTKKALRAHFVAGRCTIRFECVKCKKAFPSPGSYKKHMATHLSNDYPCHLCDKIYTRIDRLSGHLRDHLFGGLKQDRPVNENSNDESESEVDVEYEEEVKKGKFSVKHNCQICNVGFASERTYSSHINNNKCNNEQYICTVCNTVYSGRKALKYHKYIHQDERYPCEFCDRIFDRPDFLRHHKKQEHKELVPDIDRKGDPQFDPNEAGEYQCKTCGLILKNRRNLKRHVSIHSGIRYKCNMCEKEYNRRYAMNLHMREQHGVILNPGIVKKVEEVKQDIYTCETCQKTFIKRYKYKEHLQIHSDEKPFLCNLCGQSFKTKKSFNYHETRHSGIKPFKCEQCTKAYYTNKELIVHIRSHTGEKPYVCNECGAAYTHADSLTNHRRLHTGERPFKCDFCPKSFIKSERLKRHRRIHTGERPYACTYCESRFTQKYDCVKHERRHQEHQLQQAVVVN